MKVVSVVGARPQFIKASALSRAIQRHPDLTEELVFTGQHHDPEMSEVFFTELELPPPHHSLDIHGGSHGEMTGRMLQAIESVLMRVEPDVVVVYGDTNSTLAGALAASKLNIPVAHVEAGLRSYNRSMPEEVNRVAADHLSALLLCPTPESVSNLAREGIERGVHQVGDVMYDVALWARDRASARDTLDRLGLEAGGYAVATVHRAENTDSAAALGAIVDYLEQQSEERPVVLPLHPRTRDSLQTFGLEARGLMLTEPVGYLDMTQLVANAAVVLTDSGGLQKEAYFHRVPCVTMRSETEWVETVQAGWNRLWTVPDYAPRRLIEAYGDGHSADRMVELIAAGSYP